MEASPYDEAPFTRSRIRIIHAVEVEGMSRRAAAKRFDVAASTVVELLRQWKATGTYEARPQGGDRRSAPIEAHAAELLALVETRPDITLAEITDHLLAAHGKRCVPSVVWRFFDQGGSSQGRRPLDRGALGRYHRSPRHLHVAGMFELLCRRRLRSHLIGICSNLSNRCSFSV